MISGGVKYFDKNKILFRDGGTALASTNSDAAKYMLDISKYTRWESVGSSDVQVETVTITFPQATLIDRLFIMEHNLKEFSIKYAGDTTDFTNVVGLDGALGGGISETVFADEVAYYEFDAVTVSNITITMTKTQVANAEKHITGAVATVEVGTMAGFPRVSNVQHNRNLRTAKVLSGLSVIQKSYETTSFRMRFKNHTIQADIDILEAIHEVEDSFLVWLCGGRRGTDYFTVEQRGWRLRDLYNMQISRPLGANYERSIYVNGVNTAVPFIEVI